MRTQGADEYVLTDPVAGYPRLVIGGQPPMYQPRRRNEAERFHHSLTRGPCLLVLAQKPQRVRDHRGSCINCCRNQTCCERAITHALFPQDRAEVPLNEAVRRQSEVVLVGADFVQSFLERSRMLPELLKSCLSGQGFTVDGFEYRELICRRGSRRENSLSETRVRDDTTPRPSQRITCIRRRLRYETSEMFVERNVHVVLFDDVLSPAPARRDVFREERTDLRCNLSHECHLSYWLG
jgi:hypothetical protein